MTESNSNKFRQRVDRANRLARYIITIGGYGIIVSIIGILIFLMFQSLPLSFKASVEEIFSYQTSTAASTILLTGVDQYQELVYILDEQGKISFYNILDDSLINSDNFRLDSLEWLLNCDKGVLTREIFAVGTNKGRILTAEVKMLPKFFGNRRVVQSSFTVLDSFDITTDSTSEFNHPELLRFSQNEDGLRYYAWLSHEKQLFLKIYDPYEEQEFIYNLTENLGEEEVDVFSLSENGEIFIIGSKNGELFWFDTSEPENVNLRDNWKASDTPITAIQFLIGDNALVVGDKEGRVILWFQVRDDDGDFRFSEIHHFESHPSAIDQIYKSPRNRNFLTIDDLGNIHLNFSTTSRTQITFRKSDNPIQTGAFSPKSDGIILIDQANRLGLYKLDNEHPETTFKTLFGKVWYEGYEQPEFVWQSTGGSDDFESKLSLIPLIFGTLKGTIYAMLFSLPLAVLAAIYVSQFAPKWLARMVKPTVEIMAALPSVVIGFLAGLYFSPLFEEHLMSVFLFLLFLPIVFIVGIVMWRLVPEKRRMRMPVGWEIIFVIPLILTAFAIVASLSLPVESAVFAGNFKQWLYEVLGLTYDQRNSLVVGFALGFAVIPIIFTISEDALSNVPESLTSASLALGASRWQTVRKVVLPAASGGIFAAVMLGFGRAIGETMIVLMATGNTPIMDMSPFNGFRAMSACIAVEIPEAPVGGTLFRVLFLIAFLLFIFTFIVNSLSAIIGDRLRKKYARF